MTRILRLGESHKHEPRVRQVVTNECYHILSGLFKDYKEVHPGTTPPVRPVCGADEANYALLSQMLAWIVTAVTEIIDKKIISTCQSTEEMCEAIKEVNKMTEPRYQDPLLN